MMSLAGRIVRDDRNRAALKKKATQTIAVVGGVGSQATACRNSDDQGCRDANVAEMARRHFDGDGASTRVDDGVDLRAAAAARTANRLRLRPPFPPAAERWALAVVLSMVDHRLDRREPARQTTDAKCRTSSSGESDCRPSKARSRPGNPATDSRSSERERRRR
jgi:hypothetical protein